MNEEIKSCPFCGSKPRIEKEITLNKNGDSLRPNHDLNVSWEITCGNCGTSKKSYGQTYYNITDDGTLKIIPQNYTEAERVEPSDKRKEVIEKWNKRF